MVETEKAFSIQNVALLNDIVKLPKKVLEEVCIDLGLPTDGSVEELTSKVWGKIKENKEMQDSALEGCKNRLLCGRTSVMWYCLTVGATLSNARQKIIENLGFNPFMEKRVPSSEKLTSTPVVISATNGSSDHEYYLRFMYKTRNVRSFFGAEMSSIPRSSIGTVYVNEDNGCIEVRADHQNAPNIATSFARIINQQITLAPNNFANKFGSNVEAIAVALNGKLMGTSSKPELTLDELTVEQANAIVNILSAIDDFYEEENIDSLSSKLINSRESFGDGFVGSKFLALILSGLGKVGLDVHGSEHDLREAPLYSALKPFMKNQEGYVRFSVSEEGISTDFTIRVGLITNSIFFSSPATENAISYVRDHVIIN